MPHATPRSVRANCMETIKGLVKRLKKVKYQDLCKYVMRQYSITRSTFQRYIKDLIDIGLIAMNDDHLIWVEEVIDFETTERKEGKKHG